MEKILRIALILLLALSIVLSCTVVGSRLTDPATYGHTIAVLDESRASVLGLSAASAAAAAAISALPDDICTSLAEEISEFTTWFLVIMGVLYLEKYLLTIFAMVSCYLLIPVGCGALLVCCFFPRTGLRSLGTRLVALAAALLLVVPTSVWVSDRVNEIYDESIHMTIQSATAVTDNLIGEVTTDSESTTVIDEAKTLLGDLSGSVGGIIGQFKNVLNRFMEATAVMIVTTCLIPLLVVLFFGWLIKSLFNVQVVLPAPPLKPRKQKEAKEELTAIE